MNQSQTTVGIRKPAGAFGGGLISDIQLNRGDELLIRDRERQDLDEKIIDQQKTIKNLQQHGKRPFSNCRNDLLCSHLSGTVAHQSHPVEPRYQ